MKRIPRIGDRGFTLIEIMIALSILAISLLSLYAAQGNSLRASGRAENIQTASALARQKMTEKLIELQKEMVKGSFPDEKADEQGVFDPPLDNYRWEFSVRKVEIPLVEGGGAALPTDSTGQEVGKDKQVPESAQRSLMQIVTKKISESVREITVKVIWQELEEDQSLSVTTHLAKLR
ncbi:MAG TPA: hypothetical protein DF383_00110 [Deltaproteobacteria bacterium]|nr:hypothetical protein [Deltaproteobacteria bacterium]